MSETWDTATAVERKRCAEICRKRAEELRCYRQRMDPMGIAKGALADRLIGIEAAESEALACAAAIETTS